MIYIMTGGTDSSHFCCWGCNIHSLPSPQWQCKLQLASHLQPVRWFLPEREWGCGGFLRYCRHLHVLDSALCFGSPKASLTRRRRWKGLIKDLFKFVIVVTLFVILFWCFLQNYSFNCCENLVIVHVTHGKFRNEIYCYYNFLHWFTLTFLSSEQMCAEWRFFENCR